MSEITINGITISAEEVEDKYYTIVKVTTEHRGSKIGVGFNLPTQVTDAAIIGQVLHDSFSAIARHVRLKNERDGIDEEPFIRSKSNKQWDPTGQVIPNTH